ncbi:MAG: tRNA pseudouridine(55) synthase TruB [Acidobacteriota bacterium]
MKKHGLLLVDKATDCTSHDVVQQARRILGTRKIGHCGTLDPAATGLLVLTVGAATRLTRFLIRAPKVYEGTIHFGQVTDTYDAEGEMVEEHSTAALTQDLVAQAMASFEGEIDHQAPPYSAKKHQGKKYYELAREGQEIPVETKKVTVWELSPQGPLEDDRIDFVLSSSSGTYARTLAYEVGRAVGTGAHLCRLRRRQVGPFELARALTLDELKGRVQEGVREENLGSAWVPFNEIRLPFGEVTLDVQQERRIQHGQTVLLRGRQESEGDWIKLLGSRRQFLAVGAVTERIGERGVTIVQPKIVFSNLAGC